MHKVVTTQGNDTQRVCVCVCQCAHRHVCAVRAHLLQVQHSKICQRVRNLLVVRPVSRLIDGQSTLVQGLSGSIVSTLVVQNGQVGGSLCN